MRTATRSAICFALFAALYCGGNMLHDAIPVPLLTLRRGILWCTLAVLPFFFGFITGELGPQRKWKHLWRYTSNFADLGFGAAGAMVGLLIYSGLYVGSLAIGKLVISFVLPIVPFGCSVAGAVFESWTRENQPSV